MNKNITPRNDKAQQHGYWEIYLSDGLWFKCFFINGKKNGFEKVYGNGGKLTKNYHL